MRFSDRRDAGRRLAESLVALRAEHPVVLGLLRGGVPVAFEVAQRLDAPLDVVVVRKFGVPYQPELALGAVGEEGVRVVNPLVVRESGVTAAQLEAAEREARAQVSVRAKAVRDVKPRIALSGRTVVIVDDGVATGSTALAACQVVRTEGAARVVLAVPVAPAETVAALREVADEVVCLDVPKPFYSVGQFYDDFTQVEDDAVIALLRESDAPRA